MKRISTEKNAINMFKEVQKNKQNIYSQIDYVLDHWHQMFQSMCVLYKVGRKQVTKIISYLSPSHVHSVDVWEEERNFEFSTAFILMFHVITCLRRVILYFCHSCFIYPHLYVNVEICFHMWIFYHDNKWNFHSDRLIVKSVGDKSSTYC